MINPIKYSIGVKTKLRAWFLLLGFFVITVKPAAGFTVIKDTIMQNSNLVKGKPLPDFNLQTPDGTSIKLSSLKGHVVLIDFWASWCMPCRAAIPHLKELYKKYHEKGFEILSVSIDQNSKAWNNAMQKEAMPWPQAIDKYDAGKDASAVMIAFGITSVPFAIMLDKEGKVMQVNPIAAEIDQQLLEAFKP
jgi:thiol-disulfide isomerase/thioredoxin